MLTSSSLIPDSSSHRPSSNRNADVIIADSRFLFTSTSDLFSSWSFFSLAFQLVLLHLSAPAVSDSLLAIITAAGQTWPPPDYEQLAQLWTSPLLIQLPSK
ncbi:hypothetical protein F511_42036 [Dorcoceras hygrometricum]|uniref:Uncharacterized protein n=1 Tax=Dorcoceras hygrometricum TaxID=472368 RepID=A0A2Z7CLE9_9LAMI|nr:hypothetical protein F511_42036 [Dorcoceras hygrometricum]